MSQTSQCIQPIMYKFFYFKIEIPATLVVGLTPPRVKISVVEIFQPNFKICKKRLLPSFSIVCLIGFCSHRRATLVVKNFRASENQWKVPLVDPKFPSARCSSYCNHLLPCPVFVFLDALLICLLLSSSTPLLPNLLCR